MTGIRTVGSLKQGTSFRFSDQGSQKSSGVFIWK